MQTRLLLGPAGSGKTFRCLAEIRQALGASPEGLPLIFIAPKQSTYQLERQLLGPAGSPDANAGASPCIAGYTRLHILSFERLSRFLLAQLQKPLPRMLDEEGRLMVLRGLLARKRHKLKLFRASAHLTGFAQELSLVLSELQRNQLTPESLSALAERVKERGSLGLKLQDLASLLRDYLDWLKSHDLQDSDSLLNAAREALTEAAPAKAEGEATRTGRQMGAKDGRGGRTRSGAHRQFELFGSGGQESEQAGSSAGRPSALRIEGLWADGFSEWSPQELDLLAALVPCCQRAMIAFCLDPAALKRSSWLSSWAVARKSFEACKARLEALPGVELAVEPLERAEEKSRFAKNPVLWHLERYWSDPRPWGESPGPALRLAACADPQAEVKLAAREILRHVRAGGRFREVSVLVRKLDSYHDLFQRVFSRYEIPFFLDRRESVAHHPLAELTRGALRTVAFQWQHEDWFAALKTGLVPASDEEVDRLENEALARGWRGAAWQKPILLPDEPELERWLASLNRRLLPPFQHLALAMATCANKPTGPQLTAALRDLWRALEVEERLKGWAEAEVVASQPGLSASVHATVWGQLNAWLENVELAFPEEAFSLREWLPVLEAGLSGLSVGVIPPALDQVLIGAIDRSRNPEIRLALLLGLNEGVFPARPQSGKLLTETELAELENRGIILGATARQQLGRERYLGYIACTRARERLVLTYALSDNDGAVLNPSPLLSQLRRLFPSLECEHPPQSPDWRESEHVNELVAPLLASGRLLSGTGVPSAFSGHDAGGTPAPIFSAYDFHNELPPALTAAIRQWRQLQLEPAAATLSPTLAEQLYGPVLRTSVSRLEQFAACPFKFFVHSGLRAEERKTFELDVKEQGLFQHEVLAVFHDELRGENKRWRDITPAEARERVAAIAGRFLAGYRDGLLQATEQSRFLARVLTESLQDFVETLVGWMRGQYLFDPFLVEKPFGQEDAPAWSLDLGNGHRVEVQGRIDRIDLFREPGADDALCVVVDYKSSQKKLDPVLMANGLQLQLPTYLNVLRHWPEPRTVFGVTRLKPAGVFYVNLRGKYERQANRDEALEGVEQARKAAYRHAGRFDVRALRRLDSRADARKGDQFNYTLTNSGEVSKSSREALSSADFTALLDAVEDSLRRLGRSVFAGETAVAPYRKGTMTACQLCEYQAVCRIDPWTHAFRMLKKAEEERS